MRSSRTPREAPPVLERWDPAREGALTEETLRQKLEACGYRVRRYVYPPGTVFPDHSHDVDKIDAVLSGRFRMTLGERSFVLEAGDCLAVPRGALHRAEVVGDAPVVSLDATRAGAAARRRRSGPGSGRSRSR